MKNRLCAVVVIYGHRFEETATYRSLLRIIDSNLQLDLDVIVYDNSPQSFSSDSSACLFNSYTYKHDPRNVGVVPAYVFAANYCQSHGINWLLRLDQDSIFGEELIKSFLPFYNDDSIFALVPKIKCEDTVVSPSYVHLGGRLTCVPTALVGRTKKRITFINSMSFVFVRSEFVTSDLNSLHCQLDCSDHEFALSLPLESIFVLPIVVSHSLSIKGEDYVSTERYKSILESEEYLINHREPYIGKVIYKVRLMARALKFFLRGLSEHARMTIRKVF